MVISGLLPLAARSHTFVCFSVCLVGWVVLWNSLLPSPLSENWLGLVGAFLCVFCDAWPHLGAEEDGLWRPSFQQ